MNDRTRGYVNGRARGELFVIVIPDSVNVIPDSVNVIPDLIRDPWIAGRARNDKPEDHNDQAVMTKRTTR